MENQLPPNGNLSQDSAAFVPPRHWIGQEELNASYWSDAQVQEKRAQEFFDKPVETIDMIDRMDKQGIARRDFLTIMGASMAMASFACARRPVNKIIPYVVKPEELTVGVASWYASTFPETGEGLLIKTREGRPIKLEGNPDHPINQGKLAAPTQATLLDLYDPERLKQPVSGTRTGARKEASWADVDAAIQKALKASAAGAGRVRILSGAVSSDSTRRLIQEFLGAFGGGAHVEFEPLAMSEVADGQAESYGTAVVPRFRIDEADYILSLGADFLGTWPWQTEHNIQWAKRRKVNSANAAHAEMARMACFESNMTITGANADYRFGVRPGDELKIGLAVAHELIVAKKQTRFAGDSLVASTLGGYTPEAVAAEIGLEGGAEKIRTVAQDLWKARGKGLVLAGSVQAKTRDAVALQIVANFLNSALDNEGVTVDGTANPDTRTAPSMAGVEKLVADMKSGTVDVLIVYRANPAYTLPKNVDFEGALKRVTTVIYVTEKEDETAKWADYVLPDHHYLENWGDAHPRRAIYSLQQPAIAPMHSSRAFQDSLLGWIKGAELRAGGLAARVAAAAPGTNTWHDFLKANWRETLHGAHGGGASFDAFWEKVLQEGVLKSASLQAAWNARPSARSFRTSALAKVPRYKALGEGIQLALYQSVGMGDGRQANNAWLQELPDPISTITWDNYLNIGPTLAKKMGVKTDDVVEVTVGELGKFELPVNVQPGIHPGVVTAALGYGRRAVGKVGNGVGVDMFPFARAEAGQLVFAGQPVTLRKTGRFYKLAATQWHHASENRPIINDLTLAEFRKKPGASNHTDPHLRMEEVPTMWPVHEYKGYRWGMSIDLTSCTGCGACVVACQAENNIPVVGRDNVRRSREMHWIRIDRYYSGSPENPDVVFQPMLCQHCENAPCETVCPVLATVHNDEGLNEQVYNRCVGTRYCQNNCPYKVRRFNFFDHWKSYEGSMNLVWNPDVTVRTRGIMEKCTFCVQRIRDAKDQAKDQGRKVNDGDFQTACQQTCPTDAIVFGDINDSKSRVSKLRGEASSFRVLEVLNTKPSISYLTKVRNKEAGAAHGHHDGGGEHHS